MTHSVHSLGSDHYSTQQQEGPDSQEGPSEIGAPFQVRPTYAVSAVSVRRWCKQLRPGGGGMWAFFSSSLGLPPPTP